MKLITTLLAALAIGAGSLKAELTRIEFTRVCEDQKTVGFNYVSTETVANVTCYVFENAKRYLLFIPVTVASVNEANAAAVASYLTFAQVMVASSEVADKKYKIGYDEGWAAAKNDQPQPEIRKALPVTASNNP